jgi:c-di-GMP-related signal transduction protein
MATTGTSPAVQNASACIARQPILTADETVVGYELFFREDSGQSRFQSDAQIATSTAIETLNLVGLDVLCDGRPAFINCTREVLVAEYFALLKPEDVVVEIQETVTADADAIQACQRLKKARYSIALDNFIPGDKREALVPYADFIKVDISRVALDQRAALVAQYAGKHRRMIAQRVETRSEVVAATKDGFTWFQGYFFRRPEMIGARRIPATQATYLRLLSEVSKPQVDLAEIEVLIKREPALCYRLLRYLNSPLLGLSTEVLSVRHALDLLGEVESVRWIRLATTLVMGQEKCSDLVLASLVRARFCELIAPKVEHGKSDLFLLGMLSLIDAILSVPIGMVIEELSLDPDIKAQLLGAKSGEKSKLSTIYDLMLHQERGDWGSVAKLAKPLNLSLYFVAEASTAAMKWAHQITNAGQAPKPA